METRTTLPAIHGRALSEGRRALIYLAIWAMLIGLGGCASQSADRYEIGARMSFIQACIEELDDTGPQRRTVYLALNGQFLTVPEYCTQLARARQRL